MLLTTCPSDMLITTCGVPWCRRRLIVRGCNDLLVLSTLILLLLQILLLESRSRVPSCGYLACIDVVINSMHCVIHRAAVAVD